MEYTVFPEFTQHLKEYGLLGYDNNGLPYIAVPVVARYVGLELARRERRKTIYRIVPITEREAWLRRRVETIIRDLRLLERQIRSVQGIELYGINSFPEGERFFDTKPCQCEEDFVSFINTCNRCFVEAIDAYGNAQGNKNFYWNEVRSEYPGLWHALQRTRLYRHYQMHLLLNPQVDSQLEEYLKIDLEGRAPAQVQELWFVLQQCVLDGLFAGIQVELNHFN
jgi:hypothetical protein